MGRGVRRREGGRLSHAPQPGRNNSTGSRTPIKALCEEHGSPNRFAASEIARQSGVPRRLVLTVIRENMMILQERTTIARNFPTLLERVAGIGRQRLLYVGNRSAA